MALFKGDGDPIPTAQATRGPQWSKQQIAVHQLEQGVKQQNMSSIPAKMENGVAMTVPVHRVAIVTVPAI